MNRDTKKRSTPLLRRMFVPHVRRTRGRKMGISTASVLSQPMPSIPHESEKREPVDKWWPPLASKLKVGASRVRMILEPRRPASKRYSVALVLSAASVLTYWVGWSELQDHPIYISLFVSLIALIYGGLGPAFLCAFVSILTVDYMFVSGGRGLSEQLPIRLLMIVSQLFLAVILRRAWEKAEAAKKDSEALLKSRDYLVAVAAHELKTPISAMKLQIELLKKTPELIAHKRIGSLSRQVDRLTDLISSLLDVSRINTGRLELHLTDTNLSELITDVVTRSAPLLRAAGCEVRLELSGRIIGVWDRMRLEQILMNLLSNAAKYGAGKPIIVRAWSDGSAYVSVQDFGIGIKQEDQKRIFEQFERAAPKTNYGGLGLGLWIVTQIVKAKGGDIRVESEFGKGSTFTVRLPLNHELRHPGEAQTPIEEEEECQNSEAKPPSTT